MRTFYIAIAIISALPVLCILIGSGMALVEYIKFRRAEKKAGKEPGEEGGKK